MRGGRLFLALAVLAARPALADGNLERCLEAFRSAASKIGPTAFLKPKYILVRGQYHSIRMKTSIYNRLLNKYRRTVDPNVETSTRSFGKFHKWLADQPELDKPRVFGKRKPDEANKAFYLNSLRARGDHLIAIANKQEALARTKDAARKTTQNPAASPMQKAAATNLLRGLTQEGKQAGDDRLVAPLIAPRFGPEVSPEQKDELVSAIKLVNRIDTMPRAKGLLSAGLADYAGRPMTASDAQRLLKDYEGVLYPELTRELPFTDLMAQRRMIENTWTSRFTPFSEAGDHTGLLRVAHRAPDGNATIAINKGPEGSLIVEGFRIVDSNEEPEAFKYEIDPETKEVRKLDTGKCFTCHSAMKGRIDFRASIKEKVSESAGQPAHQNPMRAFPKDTSRRTADEKEALQASEQWVDIIAAVSKESTTKHKLVRAGSR